MRLVSWNIQNGRGCDGSVDLARTVRLARDVGDDPDIYCFQEVAVGFASLDGGQGADQPAQLAALLPDHRPLFGPALQFVTADGRVMAFGNMLLSRLPVLQVFSHLLPMAAASGHTMQRQALEVVVHAPSGPLRLMTTHLEYHDAGDRLRQAKMLGELQADIAGLGRHDGTVSPGHGPYQPVARPESLVLCGDFNCLPDDEPYRQLVGAGLQDAWRLCHGSQPHAPTCGLHDLAQWPQGPHCRDFFFVSQDLARQVGSLLVDPVTIASDHQPLALRLMRNPQRV